MSSPFDNVGLRDLLPSSIRNDADMAAMADSANPLLREISELIPFIELYSNIDLLPEPILRMLAWENNVFGIEWRLAQTLEEKRALVKDSFILNKRRGTRWAVERVFELLGLEADIIEWFEDGSDPFTFQVRVSDVGGRGISYDEIALLDELVSTYKPLTRHTDSVNIGVSPDLSDTRAAAAFTMVGTLTVGA